MQSCDISNIGFRGKIGKVALNFGNSGKLQKIILTLFSIILFEVKHDKQELKRCIFYIVFAQVEPKAAT